MWTLLMMSLAMADEPAVDGAALARAVELPVQADRLRTAGVPNGDVEQVLTGAKDKGVSPAETVDALEGAGDAIEEHGPVDNFGAFVQARLDEGLRGRELAAAIRAEHEANGRGRPDHAGGPSRDADGPGRSGSAGGRPDHAGGRPDHAGGRPDHAGEHDDDDSGATEDDGTGGGRPEGRGGRPTLDEAPSAKPERGGMPRPGRGGRQ